jgi:uncharacterized cupin superfamily protein
MQFRTMSKPTAISAAAVEPRAKKSVYPDKFAALVAGRDKRVLGDIFALKNFGVNLTTMDPASISALRHAHDRQDEFIYILEGNPILITDAGETQLAPGMCAGFPAGEGNGHQLVNRTNDRVVYLEVGDRTAGDSVSYPDDDLAAVQDSNGKWIFAHKDGSPY